MGNDTVDKGVDVVSGILTAGIILCVFLLALVLVITTVTNANNSLTGIVYNSSSVTNETGYANSTGYNLSRYTISGFSSPTITALYNRTSGAVVGLGNVSVTANGLVKNATATVWNNLSISYTYNYDYTNQTTLNTGWVSIQNNVVGLVVNFFALAPTIGTILAVVILIGGIVILVLYVKRMKDTETTDRFYG